MQWVHHGESYESIVDDDDDDDFMAVDEDDNITKMQEILEDIYRGTYMNNLGEELTNSHGPHMPPEEGPSSPNPQASSNQFSSLFRDAQHEQIGRAHV